MKDEAVQQQAPHDGEQTFKDWGRLTLIEILFVAFGGEGGLAHFLLFFFFFFLLSDVPKDNGGAVWINK